MLSKFKFFSINLCVLITLTACGVVDDEVNSTLVVNSQIATVAVEDTEVKNVSDFDIIETEDVTVLNDNDVAVEVEEVKKIETIVNNSEDIESVAEVVSEVTTVESLDVTDAINNFDVMSVETWRSLIAENDVEYNNVNETLLYNNDICLYVETYLNEDGSAIDKYKSIDLNGNIVVYDIKYNYGHSQIRVCEKYDREFLITTVANSNGFMNVIATLQDDSVKFLSGQTDFVLWNTDLFDDFDAYYENCIRFSGDKEDLYFSLGEQGTMIPCMFDSDAVEFKPVAFSVEDDYIKVIEEPVKFIVE